ncbi:TraR/DksA C4-type zinc finger protein [Candidatus Parcubacteria bacterium]|nr:TraR/DksA C4-type zinc finger protein [Patescibacteria group bacterium]MBU4466572.1 TraR/DksA C4-type zinc finger protein [Patescibacteria group bacterium]MCG2688638.1 TraR/DksA C4-type zinc finger protein [Candidatus Parcubacteria bacterium]
MIEKEFIEKIKTRLEKEKQGLIKELDSFADKKKNLKSDWAARFPNFQGSNLEEEADEVEEYENLISIERTLETKLQQINLAMESMEKGEYGTCKTCHQEISKERLEAIPETAVCQNCKR